MKKYIQHRLLISLFLILTTMQTVLAQDIAVVNSNLVVSEMPEAKQMQSKLKALQLQLQKKGENMVAAFKAYKTEASKKVEEGLLMPIDKEIMLKELKQKEEDIHSFEKDMQQQLYDREQQWLGPIIERINTAIQNLSKERGLKMILDTSSGVVLYVDEALDLTNDLKRKLGF